MQNEQYMEEPQLTLKDYIGILIRGKRWVIASTFVVFSASVYLTTITPPTYEAEALIIIESQNQAATVFDIAGTSGRLQLANEIEIMKSRSVAEEVVKELWNSQHRNHLYLFGTRAFIPRGQRPRRWLREILTLGTWEPEKRPRREYHEPFTKEIGHKFAGGVRGNLSVMNRRNTNLLGVRMKSHDAREAALLANTVTNVYQRMDREWSAGRILSLKGFLIGQLEEKGEELHAAEERVRAYQESELVFGLDAHTSLILNQLTRVESEYYVNLAEINIARQQKSYVENQLSEEERTLTEKLLNSINARLFALRREIAEREAELVRNASLYGEEHDAVRTTRRKVKSLKKNLNEETELLIAQGLSVADPIEYRQELIAEVLRLEGQLVGHKVRSDEYKKLVALYSSQLEKLPAKQLQYARLERDRKVIEETYGFMRQRLEEARVSEASEPGKVRIIDRALPPGGPLEPNWKKNLLLGLILGSGLGIGLVILRERIDNTVKSVEDIERLGLTVLGVVPVMSSNRRYPKRSRRKLTKERTTAGKTDGTDSGGGKHEEFRGSVFIHEDPQSPISEAYRSIRTSIAYSSADKETRSILVSSPEQGDGKSTTVANLATTFANLGKKTLLVDCDLRRPKLHRILGLSRDPGLTHFLSRTEENFDSLIQRGPIENLSFVASGPVPPNPSELLGSNRMTDLIAGLEKEWDVILFDSPALIAVTDANMISREIDQIILIVRQGSTDKKALFRSLRSLQQISAPLGGAILNAVSSKTSYGSYYYYYQHYYSGDGKKRLRLPLGRKKRRGYY